MKIIIFVLLKIAEMAGGFGIFYWFYWSGKEWNVYWEVKFMTGWWHHLLIGFAIHLYIAAAIVIMVPVLKALWRKNWEWARKF